MSKTNYRTINNKIDHSTFGGVIFPSDYDIGYSGSRNMASRIKAAENFDNYCKNNYRLLQERNKKKLNI